MKNKNEESRLLQMLESCRNDPNINRKLCLHMAILRQPEILAAAKAES